MLYLLNSTTSFYYTIDDIFCLSLYVGEAVHTRISSELVSSHATITGFMKEILLLKTLTFYFERINIQLNWEVYSHTA